MANDLNQCEFIGRLGQDPKITTMQNGNIMASFSIACSESWNNKNTGQKEEKTEWINIVAYEKLAEIISQWVKKGQQVFIQGKLQTREYTDQQGIERYSTSIKAEKMIMLGGSQAQQNNGGYQQQNNHQQPQPSPYAQAALNTAQNVVQNTPVGQAINQQFANGQSVPPAYQNNPQFAPQNPNQQPPNFNNNMQGEPKPSTVDPDIPFNALNGQLAHLI